MRKKAKNKFSVWKTRKGGRQYLALLFNECGGKCPSCGQPMILTHERKEYKNRATFDHIVPLSKDFIQATNIENLQILCWQCNHDKGLKTQNKYES